MTNLMPRTIYYLSADKLAEIKQRPHITWKLFEPTKLGVYAPRLEAGELDVKLDGSPDLKNAWHVDFIPCYTHQHFCLLVRIDNTHIVSKDRAYQNGGGFALLLATPKEGNRDTEEFTVFGICPFEKRESLRWSRFFIYYKDITLVFKASEEAQIITEEDSLSSYTLVTIPWKLAQPLTPFVTEQIGLNFWVAQAIEAEIPVQMHMLLRSEKLIAEQQPRDYLLYELQEPQQPQNGFEITHLLENRNLPLGTPGKMRLGLNSPNSGHLRIRLLIDETETVRMETDVSQGINRIDLQFATRLINIGEHQLQLEITGRNLAFSEETTFSVYDLNGISEMKKQVERLKERENPNMEIVESKATLEYLLESAQKDLEKLKPHSSFLELQSRLDRISDGISNVESNKSLFVKAKTIRMGLRSRQDNTLQPYSLYIPETFKTGQGGLIILLHGSGTNDVRMLRESSSIRLVFQPERTGMIIAAPFARGESHYYLPKEAMEEIVELTEKMMEMFSVPKEKVVLAGFSMGGFGVINTYFYKPDLYRNLMVFSGAFDLKPYVAQPDWSTNEALQKLATTNLIIFHGDADLNMPYEQQKPIHEKLEKMNPNVEIVIAKGAGHEVPPEWGKKAIEYLGKISETREG
jgi:predicted esterase